MKYSIPYKRDLNGKEKEILVFLFKNEKQEWLSLIKDLKVIARCGCGNCPTIFFGKNFNDEVLVVNC